MKFPTAAVLSATTGILLGDISGVYRVTSHLLGRSAYTHELAYYGKRVSAAICAAVPGLPGRDAAEQINVDNWQEYLAKWEHEFGPEIDLPESLRECLADDRNALDTLSEMVTPEKIVVVKTDTAE